MLNKRFFSQLLSGISLLLLAHLSHAQFRVEVSGVGLTQVPIAIAPLRGEEGVPQKISAIVQADLERSGQFKVLPSGKVIDETERPDPSDLRQKGADAVLTGSISRLSDGRFDVRRRSDDERHTVPERNDAVHTVLQPLRAIAHGFLARRVLLEVAPVGP